MADTQVKKSNKAPQTPTHLLALSGLSCMKCVGKVSDALKTRKDIEKFNVTKRYAVITSNSPIEQFIKIITQLGYQATPATQADNQLQLIGLHCKKCAIRSQEALMALPDVVFAYATVDRADVYGDEPISNQINAIVQIGFGAALLEQGDLINVDTNEKLHKEDKLTTNSSNFDDVAHEKTIEDEKRQPHEDKSADVIQLMLDGMSCAACVSHVQQALESVKGVEKAQVNLAMRSALISGSVNTDALITAVENAGYGAELVIDEASRRQRQQQKTSQAMQSYRKKGIVALSLGILLMLGMLAGNMHINAQTQPYWLAIGLATLCVMIYAGGHFYRNAWNNLKRGSATMDTLIALGTGAAWLYSFTLTLFPQIFPQHSHHLYYEASAMIIGLVNLGHMLEQRGRQRSSKALEHLLDLTPPMATIVTEQGDKSVPSASVTEGMKVRLTTGDRVPVDGVILSGQAWLNESMLTGEAVTQQKGIDDKVNAGTLVDDGSVVFITTATGSHTTLARIIQLVRQAQSSKPAIGRLADKIASVFVPVVVTIALICGLSWYLWGPSPQLAYSMIVMTTILIIACPCALGLATPMSLTAGVGRAAEFGVLVQDADALQHAAKIDTLVFDKTGTLTQGTPSVAAIETFNQAENDKVLQIAASLEQGSHHPLALAILERASKLELSEATAFKTLAGLGVEGQVDNQRFLLGNAQLMIDNNIDISAATALIQSHAEKGATPVLLASNTQLLALFALRDQLREESPSTLAALKAQGYHLVMLTGDNSVTAQAIAKEVGIDDVIAGVLPDQKSAVIEKLQHQGRKVAMVGDGINDAPALAKADVGIAMGGGSDIAMETASITLMRNNLSSVLDALSLAKATMKNMKQNLFGAFVYNSLGIPIAAGILYPLTGSLLNPIVAGAAMALSSITVVANANRLLGFKPKGLHTK